MYFYEPVMACDGIVYEEQAITNWFAKNSTSPVKNIDIDKNLTPVLLIKITIHEFIAKNPKEKENQYLPDFRHEHNKNIIKSILKNRQYDKLLQYNEFIIELFLESDSLIKCEFTIFKHIVDNCVDINAQYKSTNDTLAHKICENGDAEKIMYILNKKIDLSAQNIYGKTPFHLLCINKNITRQILKYCIANYQNLQTQDNYGNTPFDYLCSKNSKKPRLIRTYINELILVKKSSENKLPVIMDDNKT